MRTDPAGSKLGTLIREPRVVVGIIFEVGSVYITNKPALTNVPGNVVHGALKECGSVSHELFPDEARSTIGSFTFSAVDLESQLTDELRDQLFIELKGPRRTEVRLFTGDSDNFTDGTWRRVATYQITGSIANDVGLYSFTASDRQLDMRTEIMSVKTTRLIESIDETSTTLKVRSIAGFQRLQHTEYFTDAKLQLVGYLLVKKTKEIIRYTDLVQVSTNPSEGHFLGCTRNVNSVASAVEVSGSDPDQWPEILEFPYLEGTAAQIAYALLTGTILGTAITLPEHWHCGLDPAFIETDSFTNVGADFHDDDFSGGAGLILRFIHLGKADGKRFIEEEILRPMGCFLAITPEGKLKLKRFTTILAGSSWVAHITPTAIVSHGPLQHDQDGVINQLTCDYNWDGDVYTRRSTFFNEGSIATHGVGAARTMQFKGLPITQHSAVAMRRMWLGLSSRYGAPPIYLEVVAMPYLNVLEVGDVVRVTLPDSQDYSDADTFDRPMEVQQCSMNWITGECVLQLFGSSADTLPDVPVNDTTPLPDAWYESEGVALGAHVTIVGGVVTAGAALSGAEDLRDPTAIYYHGGDLTLADGETITWGGNIQLRILGTLRIEGILSSIGGGIAAIATPHVVGNAYVFQESVNVQTIGSTRGSAGLENIPLSGADVVSRVSGPSRIGLDGLPEFDIKIEAGVLTGLPADLRGTPGIYGQPLTESSAGSRIVKRLGGVGGASGGGIVIVCRALEYGAFAGESKIDVSGAAGAASTSMVLGDHTMYPGGGGGGAPGGVLIIIDNTEALPPDLSGHVIADHGATIQTGNPVSVIQGAGPGDPITGDEPGIGTWDHWQSHSKVHYLVSEVVLGEGDTELPPKPVFSSYEPTDFGVEVTLEALPEIAYDRIQIYGSIDNDRVNAVRVETGKGHWFRIPYDKVQTKWLWAYTVKGARRSEWSSGVNDGFRATGGAPYREIEHWVETFDNYASREDFEREWEIVAGDPEITFSHGGIAGGKTLRVLGAMRAVYRRNIPYDPNYLYEASCRFRALDLEAGNEALSMGFFGVCPDGTTTINGVGGYGGAFPSGPPINIPNRIVLSSCDLADFIEWQRQVTYFTESSANTLSSQSFSVPFAEGTGLWRPATIKPLMILPGDPVRAAYVRPAIECNQPAGSSNAGTEIDFFAINRLTTTDIGYGDLADGTLSTVDDNEFWALPSQAWDAVLVLDQGLNGGNELKFAVSGTVANNLIAAVNRFPLKMSDTVTVSVHYRILSVSSIGANVKFYAAVNPLTLSGEMPRRYISGVDSSVVDDVLANTLTADGSTQVATLQLTGILAAMPNADLMSFSLGISSPEASDEFDFRVRRIRLVRS